MNFTFKSLSSHFPNQRPSGQRVQSRFRAGFNATLSELAHELDALGARNVVIYADVADRDIRIDGMIRADARPNSPCILLTFDSMHGPLTYTADQFTLWVDNLRAIALTLESLRAVERYGCVKRAEQYQGWKQLPASPPTKFQSPNDAAAFIASISGESPASILIDPEARKRAFRIAAKKCHPDIAGAGMADEFSRLNAANEMLERAGGGGR